VIRKSQSPDVTEVISRRDREARGVQPGTSNHGKKAVCGPLPAVETTEANRSQSSGEFGGLRKSQNCHPSFRNNSTTVMHGILSWQQTSGIRGFVGLATS
jgi:hypothetical protein